MGLFQRLEKESSTTIEIGGVTIEVKPLSLENALRLAMLLGPHLARVQRHLPKLKEAAGSGRLLEMMLKNLAGELYLAPGDIVTAYSLLLNMPPEWIAINASAKELIEALPLLDSVNDFRPLFQIVSQLGILDNG
jgi:hypothetical protein